VATDNIEAVLAQLELERRKREDERIAAGQAVRLSLDCVVHPGGDVDAILAAAKADRIAAARANGEQREIIFDEPLLLFTGVPRASTPDDWKPEPNENDVAYRPRPAATPPISAPPAPAAPAATESAPEHSSSRPSAEPPPEWQRAWVTIASPRDERDCGIVEEIKYRVEGGALYIELRDGRAFRSSIGANDDVLAAARALARTKIGRHTSFDQPIRYSPHSIH
jgi:hypothetical protein